MKIVALEFGDVKKKPYLCSEGTTDCCGCASEQRECIKKWE